MADEKAWEELTDEEKETAAGDLLENHGIELLKTKILLLKEVQDLASSGHGPGMANYARSYALINGTYTGDGSSK